MGREGELTRKKILSLLVEWRDRRTIATMTGESVGNVIHHLRILVCEGRVIWRKECRKKIYLAK